MQTSNLKNVLLSGVALAFSLAQTAYGQRATVPVDSLRVQANRALKAKAYSVAASKFVRLAAAEQHRTPRAAAYYNAACAHALAANTKDALVQLQAAQRAGWNDAAWVRRDEDLASLRPLPAFQRTLARMDKATARQADPAQVRIVTEDIDRFWRAYDQAARDTARRRAIFEREYFSKASVGLEDYFDAKIQSVDKFLRNQAAKPNFYRSIRPNTLRIAAFKPQILVGFRRLKELYPAARFPDVYFVIGRFNSAGTATRTGLLLAADQMSGSPEVPLNELSLRGRAVLAPLESIPLIVAHEHIHFLQAESKDNSLLRGAINEGMADFLAELTTGGLPNARIHPYGNAHEKELWADFSKEMLSENWNNWIANGSQETADKPADLGYYVGYRICQAYYDEATDKKQAIADMLNISDFREFLRKSRYEEKLAAR